MERLPPALFLCDTVFPQEIQEHHRARFLSAPGHFQCIFHAHPKYRGETGAVKIHSMAIADMPEARIPATRHGMSGYIIILFFLYSLIKRRHHVPLGTIDGLFGTAIDRHFSILFLMHCAGIAGEGETSPVAYWHGYCSRISSYPYRALPITGYRHPMKKVTDRP